MERSYGETRDGRKKENKGGCPRSLVWRKWKKQKYAQVEELALESSRNTSSPEVRVHSFGDEVEKMRRVQACCFYVPGEVGADIQCITRCCSWVKPIGLHFSKCAAGMICTRISWDAGWKHRPLSQAPDPQQKSGFLVANHRIQLIRGKTIHKKITRWLQK